MVKGMDRINGLRSEVLRVVRDGGCEMKVC